MRMSLRWLGCRLQREYDSAMERQARLTEAAIDVEDARLARTEELLMLQEQCDDQLRAPEEVSPTVATEKTTRFETLKS